ncbi:MAG: LOG family protein [Thaumarchaeota archaeon]|nr:LOG family protein [Nitrososphaerota archaeon]
MSNKLSAPAHGYYEDIDDEGNFHRIPRHVDPTIDGTRLVKSRPMLFLINELENEYTTAEFDQIIEGSIPLQVSKRIDNVILKANHLVTQGKAESVSKENQTQWRRGMILSWIHSRDIETIMESLGHPKELEGKHDIEEFVKAIHLKNRLGSTDPWYKDLILSFDDNEDVNIGFFNPNFSGSLFNWGFNKMGTQNAMDAHRLSDHHLGTPENPPNLVEKAVNFVIHHLPREHYGIRHEPRGDWDNLEEVMAVDHSTKNNPILRTIARDAAKMIKLLEEEGKITPWQLLNPDLENPRPRNVELKLQGSTTLRVKEISGTVMYNPENNKWILSGGSGWDLGTVHNGDPLSVRIRFRESLEVGYTIKTTPINTSGLTISSCQVVFASEDGFRVLIDTPDDLFGNMIGFSFIINGIKKYVVPDDRTITPNQLIEDINAINNVLTHEAEYGVITVMCSASIDEREKHDAEFKRREIELKELKKQLGETRINNIIKELKHKIRLVETRITRLEKLILSSKYWESANRFGKMWGEYSTTSQKEDLGGRYVPICTGGGPGIMAAVAKGARDQNAQVIGIDSIFGNDDRHNLINDFSIHSNVRLRCNDFAIREAALINYSHVILFWPGGYGTSWEAMETLSKLQTNHLRRERTKVFFVHPEFWMPLYEYAKHLENVGTINGFTDRIKVPGINDNDDDEYYLGEFVKDENEAFEKTREYIRQLYSKNQLELK